MTQSQAVKYWLDSAKKDIKTANDSYESGHFDWCLFIWQLVIEKILKGLIAKKNKHSLPIHDLLKLANAAGIKLDQEKADWLNEITTFNIEARYDDYKFSFYKKADQKYTTMWKKRCEEVYSWLRKQF